MKNLITAYLLFTVGLKSQLLIFFILKNNKNRQANKKITDGNRKLVKTM